MVTKIVVVINTMLIFFCSFKFVLDYHK